MSLFASRNMVYAITAGYTLCILAFVPIARPLQTFLSARGLEKPAIAAIAGLAVSLVLYRLFSAGRPADGFMRRMAVLAAIVLAGWLFVKYRAQTMAEIFHLPEYGFLGILAGDVAGFHLKGYWAPVAAFAVVTAIGYADEYIQWLTPGRVYDMNDVLLNAFCGLLGILTGRYVLKS